MTPLMPKVCRWFWGTVRPMMPPPNAVTVPPLVLREPGNRDRPVPPPTAVEPMPALAMTRIFWPAAIVTMMGVDRNEGVVVTVLTKVALELALMMPWAP